MNVIPEEHCVIINVKLLCEQLGFSAVASLHSVSPG